MTTVSAISHQIWDMKYRLKSASGDVIDRTVNDTWQRIATALAEPESEAVRAEWAEKFEAAMSDFRFLPAGRIVKNKAVTEIVELQKRD